MALIQTIAKIYPAAMSMNQTHARALVTWVIVIRATGIYGLRMA